MKERDVQSVLGHLKAVKEIEKKLSLLYEACALQWQEEAAFFMAIKVDEDQHQENLDQMAQLIVTKPDRFELGRPISPVAVQTFIAGIDKTIENLRRNQISKEKILYLVRDYENSILEKNYHEVVKTSDMEYKSLAAQLLRESAIHRNTIATKIKALDSRS